MSSQPPSLHSHEPHPQSSPWHFVTMALGIGFAFVVLLLGASFIFGGILGPVKTAEAAPPSAPGTPPAPSGNTDVGAQMSMDNGVAMITLKPASINPMNYDTPSFTVKSGQQVKVTLSNDSVVPLQHNLCICKPGTKDQMIVEATKMMTDPNALAKGFIPDSTDILWHTRLINPKESQTLEFTAPAPGDYPYLCTFPGHTALMNGTMHVTP
jgi:azurin